MTMEAVLTTGIVTLSGVVGTLWLHVNASYKRVMSKLDECERDRQKLWNELAKR